MMVWPITTENTHVIWKPLAEDDQAQDYDDYDAYDILVGTNVPDDELDGLVNEIIALRSIDKKEFYDLAASEGTQIALEKFALREYSRKKLGRKLTSEEKEQRKRDRMHAGLDEDWEVDFFAIFGHFDWNACISLGINSWRRVSGRHRTRREYGWSCLKVFSCDVIMTSSLLCHIIAKGPDVIFLIK